LAGAAGRRLALARSEPDARAQQGRDGGEPGTSEAPCGYGPVGHGPAGTSSARENVVHEALSSEVERSAGLTTTSGPRRAPPPAASGNLPPNGSFSLHSSWAEAAFRGMG